jgi:glycosyltransferase involved in cell wall biosynthesis
LATRILYVEGNVDGTVGGSYFLMLDLVRSLDRKRFDPVVVFHRGNFLEDAFREAGAEVLVLPKQEPFEFKARVLNRILWPVKAAVNLYRRLYKSARVHAGFLRERRIDLVNLNNSITRSHDWMLAARMAGVPCITHEMGINERYSFLSKVLGKRQGAVICLSRAIQDAMARGGVWLGNTVVIHCGIDLARYRQLVTPDELRARHGIAPSAPVIGVVGNIRSWKGQETIVRATALVRERFPDVRCVLVGGATAGDEVYYRHLMTLCDQLGIADNVVFAGFQQNAIDYMRMMDVVCHTSTSPEPFGIVTLEAMSLAKPLVSTTIGGPAEVVTDGDTGLLVDPGKPELLAAAIVRLLADPAFARAMGQRGYKHLLERFSLATNVARTTEVYDRVLAQAKPLTG